LISLPKKSNKSSEIKDIIARKYPSLAISNADTYFKLIEEGKI